MRMLALTTALSLAWMACESEAELPKPRGMQPLEGAKREQERHERIRGLLASLSAESPAMRTKALGELGELAPEILQAQKTELVPALMQVLEKADEDFIPALLDLLGTKGSFGVSFLQQVVLQGPAGSRGRAVEALIVAGATGQQALTEALQMNLRKDTTLRPVVLEALERVLSGQDKNRRIACVDLLGLLDPPARTRLLALLDDADARVRRSALEGLSFSGWPGAGFDPRVLARLTDPQPEIRTEALALVVRSGGDQAGPAVLGALQDSDEHIRLQAVRLAASLPDIDPQVVSALAAKLGGSRQVVLVVIDTLKKLGKRGLPAFKELVKACWSKDPGIRLAAIDTLTTVQLNPSQSVPALVRLLRSDDIEIRVRAAENLRDLGPRAKSAKNALIQATCDPVQRMRGVAAHALEHIFPQGGIAPGAG